MCPTGKASPVVFARLAEEARVMVEPSVSKAALQTARAIEVYAKMQEIYEEHLRLGKKPEELGKKSIMRVYYALNNAFQSLKLPNN